MNFNYAAMQKRRGTQMQSNQNNETMRNIQVCKLKQIYPQTVLFMEDPSTKTQQYRVPLMLPISPGPLFIKVTLGNQFPSVKPQVHMMSDVTHPNVDPGTISYQGPVIKNWSQNSSLAECIKAIHDEFIKSPPMPR